MHDENDEKLSKRTRAVQKLSSRQLTTEGLIGAKAVSQGNPENPWFGEIKYPRQVAYHEPAGEVALVLNVPDPSANGPSIVHPCK